MSLRFVVLASGGGTNLQAVLDSCAAGVLNAAVVAVVSNRPESGALVRARSAGVTVRCVERIGTETRPDYGTRLAGAVTAHAPDVVILAGWMLVLPSTFLDTVGCRVINLHPALPGELPGLQAIERAHAEAVLGLRTRSGVMVHEVPDEGVDDGPVLRTVEVPVDPTTPLAEFERAMHEAERHLLISVLHELCSSERKG